MKKVYVPNLLYNFWIKNVLDKNINYSFTIEVWNPNFISHYTVQKEANIITKTWEKLFQDIVL